MNQDKTIENEKLQAEMDAILVKTVDSVRQVLEEQGETAARTLISLIAEKIRDELLSGQVSADYAAKVHDMYIHDMNATLFSDKH